MILFKTVLMDQKWQVLHDTCRAMDKNKGDDKNDPISLASSGKIEAKPGRASIQGEPGHPGRARFEAGEAKFKRGHSFHLDQ